MLKLCFWFGSSKRQVQIPSLMSRDHYRYLDKTDFSGALSKDKVRHESTFVIIGLASGNRY